MPKESENRYKKIGEREFPGGLVVRTQHFHCHGPGSIADQGTEILQVTCRSQEKKERKEGRKKTGGK